MNHEAMKTVCDHERVVIEMLPLTRRDSVERMEFRVDCPSCGGKTIVSLPELVGAAYTLIARRLGNTTKENNHE